jgi:hypothetical protein
VLVARFPVALGVALGVALAATGVFVFSMPMLRSPIDDTMLAKSPRYSVGEVRRTFRVYGVRFHYASHPGKALTMLGVVPPPWPVTGLYVLVAGGTITDGGRPEGGYERRVGNVVVHYGGVNARVRERVEAATAALAR